MQRSALPGNNLGRVLLASFQGDHGAGRTHLSEEAFPAAGGAGLAAVTSGQWAGRDHGAGGGGLAAEDFPALPGVPVFPEMFVYFLLTAWKGSTSSMVHRAGSGFRAAEDFPTLFQVCLC